MSPGFGATFADAQTALARITRLSAAAFLFDNLPASRIPEVSRHGDTTDAYLVTLARHHGLKLATLDTTLLAKPWAAAVAENPLG